MPIYKTLPQLKIGASGMAVLLLQEILRARGIKADPKFDGDGKALALDHSFGANTLAGVKSYVAQRNKQLKNTAFVNDGVVTVSLWCDLLGGL